MFNTSRWLNQDMPNMGYLLQMRQTNKLSNQVANSWEKYFQQWGLQNQLGEDSDISPNTPIETALYMISQQLNNMSDIATNQAIKDPEKAMRIKQLYDKVITTHQKLLEHKVINNKEHSIGKLLDDEFPELKTYIENNIVLRQNDDMRESASFKAMSPEDQEKMLKRYPSGYFLSSTKMNDILNYVENIFAQVDPRTITPKFLKDVENLVIQNIKNANILLTATEENKIRQGIKGFIETKAYNSFAPPASAQEIKDIMEQQGKVQNDAMAQRDAELRDAILITRDEINNNVIRSTEIIDQTLAENREEMRNNMITTTNALGQAINNNSMALMVSQNNIINSMSQVAQQLSDEQQLSLFNATNKILESQKNIAEATNKAISDNQKAAERIYNQSRDIYNNIVAEVNRRTQHENEMMKMQKEAERLRNLAETERQRIQQESDDFLKKTISEAVISISNMEQRNKEIELIKEENAKAIKEIQRQSQKEIMDRLEMMAARYEDLEKENKNLSNSINQMKDELKAKIETLKDIETEEGTFRNQLMEIVNNNNNDLKKHITEIYQNLDPTIKQKNNNSSIMTSKPTQNINDFMRELEEDPDFNKQDEQDDEEANSVVSNISSDLSAEMVRADRLIRSIIDTKKQSTSSKNFDTQYDNILNIYDKLLTSPLSSKTKDVIISEIFEKVEMYNNRRISIKELEDAVKGVRNKYIQ